MQERRPHIDRKFTDRAWGEMRQMLDREMPTTERRRRGIVWWWLLPVGLVLGVAAWGFLKYSKPKPAAPAVVAPAQPIAGNSNPSDTTSAGFQTLPTLGLPAPAGEANLSESLKFSERWTQTNLQTVDSQVNNQPALIAPPLLLQNALAELASPATFPSIRLPDISPNSAPETPVELNLVIEKPESSQSRLSFYAGGMAAAVTPANGLAVGSMAAFPLKNSKLSLEGGIGYAFVQQPLAVQVNQSIQPNYLETNDKLLYSIRTNFGNKSVAENADLSTNYSTGLQLHYLQAPVSATYSLGSKFSVYGGAVAGLLINSAKGFDQQISLDAGGSDPILNEADSSVRIPLTRFDLAATGGLNWQFLPALSLDFHYQFGVADLLKSNGIGDYNRLFQLSLRYEVKSKKANGTSRTDRSGRQKLK